jgi:dephospho-CoA kinase
MASTESTSPVKPIVAVTGGIGMGKTTVLHILAGLGARTADADDLVHELYRDHVVTGALIRRWGEGVLDADGDVDRQVVAEIVFPDRQERNWLNSLIHPLVQSRIEALADAGTGPLYCGIPLLYEVGWESRVSLTVAVWCARTEQTRRLECRGWTRSEIERRISTQLPAEDKLTRADYAIINSDALELLREQCQRLLNRIEERGKEDPR